LTHHNFDRPISSVRNILLGHDPDPPYVQSKVIVNQGLLKSRNADRDGYLEGAPALAIEVASESNTAAQLDLKMELYFAHGAEEVWVVYPQTRRVRAHFPDGHSETLATGLQSALFPGWSAPLSGIFTA
jgi:Uma2 family endonuclease